MNSFRKHPQVARNNNYFNSMEVTKTSIIFIYGKKSMESDTVVVILLRFVKNDYTLLLSMIPRLVIPCNYQG